MSKSSKELFELGIEKSNRVEKFFKNWHEPELETNTATEMNKLYINARDESSDSDEIFNRIMKTICGKSDCDPSTMIAALAIMAYFFQTCDIFENSREDGMP